MDLAARVDAYKEIFGRRPASFPWLVEEQGRPVLYAIWVIGADYRNASRLYGAFPPGLMDRLMALFQELRARYREAELPTLHACSSGSLRRGPYVRLDLNRAHRPDVVGSVYDVGTIFGPAAFELAICDPPYSPADALRYGTPMVDRRRAVAALAEVVRPGGHLAWLDTCWPLHAKTQWVTVGRIFIQRSTNHRVRLLSLFERQAAA